MLFKKRLPVLTNSALKNWRACQRKYRLRYVDGYEPVNKGDNLSFGTLVHTALEKWWLDPAHVLASAWEGVDTSAIDPFALARAQAMMMGYSVRWGEWAQSVRVLRVEGEFGMPLVNPATGRTSRLYQLGGKLDLLVQLADGTIAIVEHKTSSEDFTAGSAYRSRLLMDGQVTAYFAGAEAMGYEATLCLYDVLGKPGLKPLQVNKSRSVAETPEQYRDRCIEAIASDVDRYYAHVELVRLHSEREEWGQEVWQQAQSIQAAKVGGAFPRTPESCFNFGRPCEFYPVCSSQSAITDTSLYRKLEPDGAGGFNVELSSK